MYALLYLALKGPMKNFILLLLSTTLSFKVLAFDYKPLDLKIKAVSLKVTAPFGDAIKRKLLALKEEEELIKKGKSWNNVNLQLKALKDAPEHNSLYRMQETLNLLNALEDSSFLQHQPELLEAVSSLLQSTTSLGQPYRSFFLKERARLMDGADETIILKTKLATIADLKKDLSEEIQKQLKKVKSLDLYKTLTLSHNKYLSEKKTKKVTSLIEKIKSLEQEKEILLLTNKQLLFLKNQKDLLLSQTKAPCLQTKASSNPNKNELNSVRLSLFMAPLEIVIL